MDGTGGAPGEDGGASFAVWAPLGRRPPTSVELEVGPYATHWFVPAD